MIRYKFSHTLKRIVALTVIFSMLTVASFALAASGTPEIYAASADTDNYAVNDIAVFTVITDTSAQKVLLQNADGTTYCIANIYNGFSDYSDVNGERIWTLRKPIQALGPTTKKVLIASGNSYISTDRSISFTAFKSGEDLPDDNTVHPIYLGNGKYSINNQTYTRTFTDDFNGTQLDLTKWERCPEWTRVENNVWRNDMSNLDGEGHLVLSVEKLDDTRYKSGAVRTRGKFYQKQGYFEIRCKLQRSTGYWGAFWLMPDIIDTGVPGGSDGTEIDIFESAYLKESKICHAVHYDYGNAGNEHGKAARIVDVPDIYDGNHHTFSMDWNDEAYIFYIDGVETARISSADVDISKIETYLKISVEVGSWAGKVVDSELPDEITVDYVNVYQREN